MESHSLLIDDSSVWQPREFQTGFSAIAKETFTVGAVLELIFGHRGVHMGRILIEGGASNFCFGRDGEIFALNEHRLWRVQLGIEVKGSLLGI
jgi:hypothetical protein